MSAAPATRVRLADPSELIAAVPHLLGFHPRDSLVLISLDGRRLGMTLRADLVDPEHRELLAEQLTGPLVHQQPPESCCWSSAGCRVGPRPAVIPTPGSRRTAASSTPWTTCWPRRGSACSTPCGPPRRAQGCAGAATTSAAARAR